MKSIDEITQHTWKKFKEHGKNIALVAGTVTTLTCANGLQSDYLQPLYAEIATTDARWTLYNQKSDLTDPQYVQLCKQEDDLHNENYGRRAIWFTLYSGLEVGLITAGWGLFNRKNNPK